MNTSTANFSITLKPSKALFLSLSALHLFAAISISLLFIAISVKLALVMILLLMAVKTIKQYVLLKTDHSIAKLNCLTNCKCRLELNNGKVYQVKIISAEWLFNYFAVLVLRNNSNKFKATIAKDTLSQEQFYALHLYLRSLNK